ncbi:Protein FRG2-like-1 [Manis javanica]|nr:Protein FRG2-like-1 [Manis javanica]
MVTTVRAMAEAVYRDVVLMQSQLARSPPDWEQLWRLAELRGRLCETTEVPHQVRYKHRNGVKVPEKDMQRVTTKARTGTR